MKEEIISTLDLQDEELWANAVIIHIELKLKEKVDGETLQKAANLTKEHYIHLQIKPKIINDQLCYVKNPQELIVRNIDHTSIVTLGKDTNEFPYSISYDGCYITCVFHHGLFDGRPSFEIIKTLLLEYYKIAYDKDYRDDSIYSVENPLSLDDQLEYPYQKYSKEPLGDVLPIKGPTQRPDGIDASYMGEDTVYYRLIFDSKPFIGLVKELNTTPFALLSCMMLESMRPLIHAENPYMLAIIIAEYRNIFGSKCIRNFSDAELLDYDTKALDNLPLDLKCTVLRSKLDLKLDKNSILAKIKNKAEEYNQKASIPYSEKKKKLIGLRDIQKVRSGSIISSIISYIGKINMGEELSGIVEDIKFYLPPVANSTMVECFDLNGKMIMNMYTRIQTDAPFRNMQAFLRGLDIPSDLEYNGIMPNDVYESDALV